MTRVHGRAPLLLGHRGARASRHIPENTFESFELCLEHGCDGFEFDVRRSADGVAVICHDPVIGGLEVALTPASVLKLPSLQDVLREFSGRAFLDIELKVAGLEGHLAAALNDHPPQKGCVVSSFLPEVLRSIHRSGARIPLGFLYDHEEQTLPTGLPVIYSAPRFTFLTSAGVAQIHAAGGMVMTWTVNRADDMRRFAEWGVDAIISDDTQLLVQTLR